jgi:hypothetical protein
MQSYSLKKAILFSEKTKSPNIYKGLAIDFKDQLDLAFVQSTNTKYGWYFLFCDLV